MGGAGMMRKAMKPIWIVDDDKSIRWVLEKALARENIPCRLFASAREAIEALAPKRSTNYCRWAISRCWFLKAAAC